MKIVAVNIAFRTESFYKRWRLLSQEFNADVTLVGPQFYVYKQFGEPIIFKPEDIEETNFKVHHIDMEDKTYLRHDWLSWRYFKILKSQKPDIVYLLGLETRNVVFTTYLYKKLYNPNLKIGLFSMRGTDLPLHGKEFSWRWSRASKIFDFINVHYPKGKEIFETQGRYLGPIQLQTQIGVDKDVYFKDPDSGRAIRKMYNISENEFVFGSASRIEDIKGVFDILEAISTINLPFKFIMMGDGKHFKSVRETAEKLKILDKVIIPGRIETGSKVAAHLNALDCFVHVPHTTKAWVDTFPLAVVQAMATQLPIIGSDSGAVPYQLGEFGIIIPEKDSVALANAMTYALTKTNDIKECGVKLYERVIDSFEIRHLNKCLYATFKEVKENSLISIKDQVHAFKNKTNG